MSARRSTLVAALAAAVAVSAAASAGALSAVASSAQDATALVRADRRSAAVGTAAPGGGSGETGSSLFGAPALQRPPAMGTAEPPGGWPAAPLVSAESFLLMDADTGQVLAAKDGDLRRPVASTIKVLTALSVLRRVQPQATVVIGDEVLGLPYAAAVVGLEPGQTWTVAQLLDALIARSGNDAALALAAFTGGTVNPAGAAQERVETFMQLMRDDAAALGLDGIVLADPDGLTDGNLVSARDLAVITRAALTDPYFDALAGRQTVELPGLGQQVSRNVLLQDYPGAFGVKTGFTTAAGMCLIAGAERDGHRLLAVVLNSAPPDGHFGDARQLLDFGFARFALVPIASEAPALEMRVPGRWIALDAPGTTLLAPVDDRMLTWQARFPIEAEQLAVGDSGPAAASLTALWHGNTLGTLPLVPRPPATAATHPGPAGAVGAWLLGRTYAAMRAATGAGAWTASRP